jgi:hypothetical protein
MGYGPSQIILGGTAKISVVDSSNRNIQIIISPYHFMLASQVQELALRIFS